MVSDSSDSTIYGRRAALIAMAIAQSVRRELRTIVHKFREHIAEHPMPITDQISVPLPADLRAFVERRAEAEERSIAAVVRRLIAEAARHEPKGKAAA